MKFQRVVASPRRRKTKNYPAKSSNEASQQPQPDVRRPDRHDRDAAGRSHGHDTTSEVRLDHAEGENGNAEAHGCCNVFWVWLCYKGELSPFFALRNSIRASHCSVLIFVVLLLFNMTMQTGNIAVF